MPRPLFFFAAALALLPASAAQAQDPIRPWLDWRTMATPTHRFHYRAELEAWTRAVATRVEAIDSALAVRVGFSPERPVHIVVDDPFGQPNGYALPLIDRPATVWWAFPADPRNDIGNFSTWGELLAVHELAHLAHLTRPSRNPLDRRIWETLSANLGPITRRAPRWVYEGYATVLEGQISGTGRPNNAWRPAILRQWAIEGQLPTYQQLNGTDRFGGGELAYLGGSAFLEWLLAREGDSTLMHVWRRMTARRVRSFDAAFAGVYGDAPAALYGWHAAEVTRDAMAARDALAAAGLVEGELVQRLTWDTGDPAVSPDGQRIAITLRDGERPGRVVVWSTTPEPEDTAAMRALVDALRRDPYDVADRRFYPRPRKAQATLLALNGRSFQQPRWFRDNRTVLVTRWTPRGDGSVAPELYAWDTESDDVRQLTSGAGVLQGDPSPDGRSIVAMQCRAGSCGIVRVAVSSGAVTTLLGGSPRRTYYRPRFSPDGTRIAASVHDAGRWRVLVANADGTDARVVDPDDGVNRYDAAWTPAGDALIVTSERGGIPNVERLPLDGGAPRSLTRVTGAAVAPDLSAGDSSVWFLALHARGYDLRRVPLASDAGDVVPVTAGRFGFAGTRGVQPAARLAENPVAEPRGYGVGPRHSRWLPGGYASGDGVGGFLTVFDGDIIGRLGLTVTGAYGEPGTWQGGEVRASLRAWRPTIEVGIVGALHRPGLSRDAQPGADSLDVTMVEPLLAFSAQRLGDGWLLRGRAGGAAGRVTMERTGVSSSRTIGFGEMELHLQQQRGAMGLVERLRVHSSAGEHRGRFHRTVGAAQLATVGRDMVPLELRVTIGAVTGSAAAFERFSIGGIAAPIGDSSTLSQRYAMPMFPTAMATGTGLAAWRIAMPSPGWTLFFEGASVASGPVLDPNDFTTWHRAAGMEIRLDVPPIPVVFTPSVRARAGVAYTFDEPFRRKVRAYLAMRMLP